ncbi:transposable element Tcb2 transposase [Trichonephila clavipes]|nr:transposable element Tcb2 transposase [Trichonephila clavipes]
MIDYVHSTEYVISGGGEKHNSVLSGVSKRTAIPLHWGEGGRLLHTSNYTRGSGWYVDWSFSHGHWLSGRSELKTHPVEGLIHVKSDEIQNPHVEVEDPAVQNHINSVTDDQRSVPLSITYCGKEMNDLEPFLETGSAGRRPGQSRRCATMPNEDRYLVLTARRHRNMNGTLLQQHLRSATGTTVSTQTVRNRLHGVGLYARRPIVCVRLTSRHRRVRREWATEHVNWRRNE